MTAPLSKKISRHFKLEQYGSNIPTEILAGVSTYLSLAYIFIVNPAILSQAGIDPTSAFFATALIASLSTLAMGMWANLPFAVAPGMTMNSYFVFVVCQKMGFTWQQGLATVFVSGVLCVLLTALPLRQTIIDSIPQGLKQAIAVTIGVFVATIGLFLAKIIVFTPAGMVDFSALTLAHITSPLAIVMFAGLAISILLGMKRFRFTAGMLIAIILSSILYHYLIPDAAPATAKGDPLASFAKLDFSIFFDSRFWVPVIVFFVLDFFEGIGGFIGMTSNTSIQDKDGNVPHIKQGLWVDGFGTIGGSVFGTSSLIIFVESAVGIKAGGRTGLTAIACGILMLAGAVIGYYFAPFLTLVPAEAAAGVLMYVGYLILSSFAASKKSLELSSFDIFVMAGMGLVTLLTFSLDKSLAFGFASYFILSVYRKKPAYWLGVIAAVLGFAIVFSG